MTAPASCGCPSWSGPAGPNVGYCDTCGHPVRRTVYGDLVGAWEHLFGWVAPEHARGHEAVPS